MNRSDADHDLGPIDITAMLLTMEYGDRHGTNGHVREIAAALLAEMFDPVFRHAR
jgi:hypothetical protein